MYIEQVFLNVDSIGNCVVCKIIFCGLQRQISQTQKFESPVMVAHMLLAQVFPH